MLLFDRLDPTKLPALRVLVRRLGFFEAVAIAITLERRVRRGEPFVHLPPATDRRERHARDQAGPALVLYRVLLERGHDPARARDTVADTVKAAAVAFLSRAIGPLRRASFATMSEPARRRWVTTRAARFPNAEPVFEVVDATQVRFRVHACRFVALAREAGHPDLAPVFCAGDAHYFGTTQPDVTLERPHTLAEGGPDCPFTLRFR